MSIIDAYKALADESRLRLIYALSTGRFTVQELTAVLSLSQSTVSHHLKVLTQAGMVQSEKAGTWVFYRLTSEPHDGNNETSAAALLSHQFVTQIAGNLANGLTPKLSEDSEKLKKIVSERRDATKNFFDQAASSWKSLREEIQGRDSFFSEVLKHVNRDDTLLELGCGAGSFLDSTLPRPGKTIAVDYSEPMLDAARKNLGTKAEEVDLRLGYLEHLPVANDSVDSSLSYMVLHHINEPKEVIRDVFRVTRPGGNFIIVELARHTNEVMRERFADVWLGFSQEELHGWLTSSGFADIHHKKLNEKVFLTIGVKPLKPKKEMKK